MDSNMITYAENSLETFAKRPFCSVDSLILAWVSYFHMPRAAKDAHNWKGIPLLQLFHAEDFDEMFHNILEYQNSRRLLTALAASPRFRDILVMGSTEQFDAVSEKQFAAVTFQLTPALGYVAFRGTDSTLIGWKEDFNMAFQSPVPSQQTAALYLTEAARHCTGTILTGGHSKGGNLAVYASAKCSPLLQNRIGTIYSHDGPGFLDHVLQSADFLRISPKIEKTLPQSSIVGMLLEQQENFRIVKSSRISFCQHDPFSWIVENNQFCYIDQLTPDAIYLNRTLNGWIRGLSRAERERFVDTLYGILNTNDLTTLAEWRADWQKNIPAILHAAAQTDDETKLFLLHTLKELAGLSVRNLGRGKA